MPAPYDYASTLGGNTGIAPSVQNAVMGQQNIQGNTLTLDSQALQLQLAQRAEERQQAMQADFATLANNPTAAGYAHFMTLYPEQHDALGKAWDALDKRSRDTTLRTVSDVYGRLQSGDTEGAIAQLQAHMDAGTAAGEDVSNYPALIAAIREDPKKGAALAGYALASAVGADKFGEMFGKLNPTDKQTEKQKEYDWRVSQFGKAAADTWLSTDDTKFIPVQAGGQVFAAGGAPTAQPPAAAPTADATGLPPPLKLAMPVHGGTLTSGFGDARDGGSRLHDGQDIAAPAGTPVTPVAAGTVVAVGRDDRNGNFVRIRHPDGTVSGYGHLGSVKVSEGQQVIPGSPIGTVGATGNATGNVLHLTVRDKNGKAINPRPLLLGATVVRSKQAYDALPHGAEYIAPDGSHRRKG